MVQMNPGHSQVGPSMMTTAAPPPIAALVLAVEGP
jgi:hypothetical protein